MNMEVCNYKAVTFLLLMMSTPLISLEVNISPNCTNLSDSNPPCITLSHYLSQPHNESNSTLLFLPGDHIMDAVFTNPLQSSSIVTKCMNASNEDTRIVCTNNQSYFIFSHIPSVLIDCLVFVGCSHSKLFAIRSLVIVNAKFLSQGVSSTGLALDDIDMALIENTEFIHDSGIALVTSIFQGGAIFTDSTNLKIVNTNFTGNSAILGGAIFVLEGRIEIIASKFTFNAAYTGGAILFDHTNGIITHCSFFGNTASNLGINLLFFSFVKFVSIEMKENVANFGAVVITAQSKATFSNTTVIESNVGGLFLYFGEASFDGETYFVNNTANNYYDLVRDSDQGGAVTSILSNLTFTGSLYMTHNRADYGGAIVVIESMMMFWGTYAKVSKNSARKSGGGIYAYKSEINFNMTIIAKLTENEAAENGGGIYASSSNIILGGGILQFVNNTAKSGGGIYLQQSSKVLIFKEYLEYFSMQQNQSWLRLDFIGNMASEQGGAIYVSDESNREICLNTEFHGLLVTNDCFMQTYDIHITDFSLHEVNVRNIYFVNNSRDTLYGGLLDRCAVSTFAEVQRNREKIIFDSTTYLSTITNLDQGDIITSDPVQICFCTNNQTNCNHQLPTMHVRRGEEFYVSLVAVDQLHKTVPNTLIHGYINSQEKGLKVGQGVQETSSFCTNLAYCILSTNPSEQLTLYAEGPCKDLGISKQIINVTFEDCFCPVGFLQSVTSKDECICNCDSRIESLIANCTLNSASVLRKDSSWISYINDTFLMYHQCPFDYCYPADQLIQINLNIPNGADAQCAFNRTGKLCSSCNYGLSLSLGSSRCMPCSTHWLSLLIPFSIAGIMLVAFVLMLNMTVAAGSINGLIFYANIIFANQSLLLPIDKTNFRSVFIAWLNLDFGIETCFYDGMDAYAKTWLQFVFPVYIIVLIILIIIISEYSSKFASLISCKNPVATLSTLLLLSYTKLLRTIIIIFSFANIQYSDGSSERVWLFDANIAYLQGKHIPLFIVAVVILLFGMLYTFLLLFWQLLLKVSNRKPFMWINNTKLKSFIDSYHAPFEPRHRYWAGLLLLLRGVLYLISGINLLQNSNINFVSVGIVVLSIIVLNAMCANVYKNWILNSLEITFLYNLALLTMCSFYIRENGGNQKALAITSTSISFVLFSCIVACHIHKYVLSSIARWQKLPLVQWMEKYQSRKRNPIQLPDCKSNENRMDFNFLDDPLSNADFTVRKVPPVHKRSSKTMVTSFEMDGKPGHDRPLSIKLQNM